MFDPRPHFIQLKIKMAKQLTDFFLEESSYLQAYLLTVFYFLVLYFVLAPLFLWICIQLEKKGIAFKILESTVSTKSKSFEIKNSVISMLIFGLTGIIIVFFKRHNLIEIGKDSALWTLVGVLILTIWNEVHFFIVHRIMHLPFFYKHVHKIHHQSKIPTVYSVYSFHWLEALLLSLVPIAVSPFINFSAPTFILYPIASIVLNLAGHCNYRIGGGKGPLWTLFATRHSQHHFLNRGNYGFASGILDRWIKVMQNKIKHE